MEHYINNLLSFLDIKNGFYIEAGANNGIFQSYTYELEKNGWKGILIEPSIVSYNECLKNRKSDNIFFNCALVSDDNIKKISGDFNSGSLMSSVNGNRLKNNQLIEVSATTISSILKQCNISDIDLFSLDVEGYEIDVLNGLDFNIYKPKYFVIEIYLNEYDLIYKLLNDNGYKMITNLTNYNKIEYPKWDGLHNDYLFKLI
jgi:FkbM family methyltransferase